MPLRANLEDVRALLGNSEADVWVALQMANEMVDELLASSGLSTTVLKHIEMYLACHIYSQASPDVVRESYAGATFDYGRGSTSGEGLCGTKWGQMALQMDTSGILAGLGQKRIVVHLI